MGKEILLEIGTEEIPARFTPGALESLAGLMKKELERLGISFGQVQTLGTPRRLVLWVGDVGEFQQDMLERRLGPPKHLAFDERGRPTKAVQGFARAQGVSVAELQVVATEKGEYLCAVKHQRGRKTVDVLKETLPTVITSIPFAKSMRWGGSSLRFVRPIHWILALFDGQVIPFRLEGIESGNLTYGHRFMSPGGLRVKGFADYLERLRRAWVIVDAGERRRMIEKGIQESARRVSGRAVENPDLLEEVTYLVEFPVVILGDFDGEFLALPKEVIVHAMEEHQRYFPVADSEGALLPHFVCVCNTCAENMETIKRGNERVLRARLSDARFFFEEDAKVPLARRVEALKEVVFQAKLGTSYEKVMRLRSLSGYLARKLAPEVEGLADRAALLCKADLVTGLVGEFPGLQGIIGREYALRSGEPREIADAIREHYLPAFAGDRLPSSPIGDFVSIADKVDTITGCFGVGLIPTGAGDPFALRRQALGVLNIILQKRYRLSLRELIRESLALLKDKVEGAAGELGEAVLAFFRQRFQNLLLSRGVPQDVVEAVIGAEFDDVALCQEKIEALAAFKKEAKEFAPLAAAFKRVVNISRGSPARTVEPSLFQEDVERELYKRLLDVKARLGRLLAAGDYRQALIELTKLKAPVDRFFDGVLVMDEDKRIRENRLALLGDIVELFLQVADFSKLSAE